MSFSKEQKLIDLVEPDLPITVYPEREILPKLKEVFKDESITLKSEFEFHSLTFYGEAGGITAEVRSPNVSAEEQENVFLCSITHFRIKRGEPHYKELEKYRLKRVRKLLRASKRNRFY